MIRKILIFVSIVFIIFLIYSQTKGYYRTKEYIKKMNTELVDLSISIRGDLLNFADEFPKKKNDFSKIINRYKKHSSNRISFLDYGYNLKYDSINKITLVYSYGLDKKDNDVTKTPFNSFNKNSFPRSDINFNFNNFLNARNSDIIFFAIKDENFYDICRIKDISDIRNINLRQEISDIYKISKRIDFVSKSQKNRFIESLKILEKNINKRKYIKTDYKKGKTRTIFFRYKNSKISVVCDNDISKQLLEKYRLEIEQYFLTMDKSYFDYAVFPITFVEDIYKPRSPRSR